MRIALLHMRHAATGGTERYLNLLSAHLAETGHEPVIVCRSHGEPHHGGVEFVKLHPFALGGAARMWSFAVAVQKHVKAVPYDLTYALGRTWSHDVIRMGGGCHQTYLDEAHEATRTPIDRLLGLGGRKNRVTLEIERRALQPGAYRQVITNSELTKRDAMARHKIPEDRIFVIHNGADTERFHPRHRDGAGRALRSSLGWGEEERVLLFLGTGYGRKGLDRVLEATAELAHSEPKLRLLVVGYDSASPEWEARAARLGISDRCAFLGGRSDAEVCFGASDVYILPTRYDPFANSTVEAMASGLPTITTPTNGGCELIQEGINGSLLSADPRPAEMAQSIQHWMENRASGSLAARQTAEENDAAGKLEQTCQLLEQVLLAKRE